MAIARAFLRAVKYSGCSVLGLTRGARRRCKDSVVILVVHGVGGMGSAGWQPYRRYVRLDRFRAYARLLRTRYTCISLGDAIEMLSGRTQIVANAVVLTFDDGYRNHCEYAWPICREYGIPATFFVVAGLVADPQPYWFDRVDFAFRHLERGRTTLRVALNEKTVEFPVGTENARVKSFWRVLNAAKMLEDRVRSSIVEQVEIAAKKRLTGVFAHDPWTGLMTVEDIRRLGREGADIGSHTVSHLVLDRADNATAARELSDSKQSIEDWTGLPCRHFCYPRGRWRDVTPGLVAKAGYEGAVSSEYGRNALGADRFLLRRIALPNASSSAQLDAKVAGLQLADGRLQWPFFARAASP